MIDVMELIHGKEIISNIRHLWNVLRTHRRMYSRG